VASYSTVDAAKPVTATATTCIQKIVPFAPFTAYENVHCRTHSTQLGGLRSWALSVSVPCGRGKATHGEFAVSIDFKLKDPYTSDQPYSEKEIPKFSDPPTCVNACSASAQ
jgi:hypothetical protein